MQKPIKNIQDIYSLAGGSTKLAAKLGLHAYTVENWRRAGIPLKYWDTLYNLYGVSPAELHSLYKRIRAATQSGSTV